ncbi:MAG: DUF881 domain-containing protein [Thermacetogeniaceae bacterium]|jgi:uncharacterized protein YlxW (UPF0749 family)
MDNVKKWRTPVLIVFLLLGVLISVQFHAQQIFRSDLSLQSTDDLTLILKGLQDKRANLEKELQDLEQQQQALNSDTTNGASLARNLTKESNQLEIAFGLIPVKGPGITVTIPPDSNIVYLDLVDIINELWSSQAEAISINDQRITAWTTIYWNKEKMTITVNGADITFPCTIKAIGNPDTLEAGLRLLGGVLDNLAVYKIYPVVQRSSELDLPGAAPPVFHYLQPVQ